MGVPAFNIASSVILITAQRLGRKLCTQCKKPEDIPPEALLQAGFAEEDIDGTWQAYGPVGCDSCFGTGYKGRVGVYQLLVMSEQLEALAAAKASREELERAAIEEGMRTLWDDGLSKVAAGLTSLEELARVTTV